MPITAVAPSEDRLQAELDLRASRLRPPAVVMQPAVMGAARLTRYSSSRTMLRRAVGDGWRARLVRFDIDGAVTARRRTRSTRASAGSAS